MTETTLPGTGAAMDRRIERPHAKRRKRIMRSALAIAVVAAAVLLWLLMPGANALTVDAAAIRTGDVVRAPFRDFVPLRAEVAPLRTVFVTAISGGQVADLATSDGAMVAAGTPLARLSNPSLELDVASRSAEIVGQLSAISGQRLSVQNTRQDGARDLAEARNALSKARTLLAQKQVLFDRGIITRAAIDPVREDVGYQQARVAALDRGTAKPALRWRISPPASPRPRGSCAKAWRWFGRVSPPWCCARRLRDVLLPSRCSPGRRSRAATRSGRSIPRDSGS